MNSFLGNIPGWIISAVFIAFIGILLERIYISGTPIKIFGEEFGPVVDSRSHKSIQKKLEEFERRFEMADEKLSELAESVKNIYI